IRAKTIGGFYSGRRNALADSLARREAVGVEYVRPQASPIRRPGGRRIGDVRDRSARRARGLRGFLPSVLLLHARAVERAVHRLVPLVAGVLEDLILGALHEQDGGPRPRPVRWVVYGDLVFQGVGVEAAEPLDQVQLVAAAAPANRGVAAEV